MEVEPPAASQLARVRDTGSAAQAHYPEAFGNTLSSWTAGYIGGDRAGWPFDKLRIWRHHNTKEFSDATDLVFMYQRWYMPETGIFLSQAPYPPMIKNPYSFAGQDPLAFEDPAGRCYYEVRTGRHEGVVS